MCVCVWLLFRRVSPRTRNDDELRAAEKIFLVLNCVFVGYNDPETGFTPLRRNKPSFGWRNDVPAEKDRP